MKQRLKTIDWTVDVEGATLEEIEQQATELWEAFAGPRYSNRLLHLSVSPSATQTNGVGQVLAFRYAGTASTSFEV